MKQRAILLVVGLGFFVGIEATEKKGKPGRYQKKVVEVSVNGQPYQVLGDERGACIAPVQAKKPSDQKKN